jgi:hypothetical protein
MFNKSTIVGLAALFSLNALAAGDSSAKLSLGGDYGAGSGNGELVAEVNASDTFDCGAMAASKIALDHLVGTDFTHTTLPADCTKEETMPIRGDIGLEDIELAMDGELTGFKSMITIDIAPKLRDRQAADLLVAQTQAFFNAAHAALITQDMAGVPTTRAGLCWASKKFVSEWTEMVKNLGKITAQVCGRP